MKAFKSLFIKEDIEDARPNGEQKPAFPVTNAPIHDSFTPSKSQNPYADEVIDVYEKGLQSINMPGYDFYDFFSAVKAAGTQNEAIYKMAFQMGRTMDAGITAQKLAADAEYYISKVNEVHRNYSEQGNQKLGGLSTQLRTDKESLASEATHIESEISKLRQQIQTLESQLNTARQSLSKIDEKYKPQQDVIQQKLMANDQAMQVSIQTLTTIRDGILKYLK